MDWADKRGAGSQQHAQPECHLGISYNVQSQNLLTGIGFFWVLNGVASNHLKLHGMLGYHVRHGMTRSQERLCGVVEFLEVFKHVEIVLL